MMKVRYRSSLIVALALATFASLAQAAAIDTPELSIGVSGHGKQALTVTAGPSGLPDGFTVWWMDAGTFASYNRQWQSEGALGMAYADFTGAPTLNTFGGTQTTFQLGPNESVVIEIGDLADETGVAGVLNELDYGRTYVFTAFGSNPDGTAASPLSNTVTGTTTPSTNCTYTMGYWKNHPNAWPVASLMLGSVSYTKAEMLLIFDEPVEGNGLISLAHQLIAAKLNIANGADPTAASAAIAAADALIGSMVVPPIGTTDWLDPSVTSPLTQTLDDYNNGVIGPGHCGSVPARPASWGQVKGLYR